MEKIFSLWDDACGVLRKKLSKDVYDRWIAVIRPLRFEKETLILTVANDFYLSWLEENYLSLIRDALVQVAREDLSVALQVDAAHPVAPPLPGPVPTARPRREKNRILGSPLFSQHSFSSFVVGPSNNFAHASALAVAQSPGRAYNPLLFYGGSGVGKTHLLQAIGHHVYASSETARICYVSSETFLNDYIESLRNNRPSEFRAKYRSADLLLIDDVHFFAAKDRIMEEFFHTFNDMFVSGRQIVLTCDRPISEVKGLEHRLISRLEWGLVTQLEPPDLEVRLAILRQKERSMNLRLPDEILMYIAERIHRDIRKLEGALNRVVSYASLSSTPIDLPTVERLLRDMLDRQSSAPPSLDAIQKIVAEQFDIRLADMTSKSRPQSIAFPRQVAMYLCRTLTQQSLPAIGSAFNRNHATVLHACRTVAQRAKQDEPFRRTLTEIRQRLDRDPAS
ncbi:MAG: chromosomal replication initiator protein DnaA [Kiritimatiellia bacterium]|nr:chromosomal replication initiator protein DnaA [Kiritimatiellia bacterium]